jgi:hypothetical protein
VLTKCNAQIWTFIEHGQYYFATFWYLCAHSIRASLALDDSSVAQTLQSSMPVLETQWAATEHFREVWYLCIYVKLQAILSNSRNVLSTSDDCHVVAAALLSVIALDSRSWGEVGAHVVGLVLAKGEAGSTGVRLVAVEGRSGLVGPFVVPALILNSVCKSFLTVADLRSSTNFEETPETP